MTHITDETIADVIGTVYDVAAGDGDWDRVLNPLQSLVGASVGVIHTPGSDNGQTRFWGESTLPDGALQTYADYFYQTDIWLAGGVQKGFVSLTGHVALGQALVPWDDFRNSEWRNDFLHPNGLEHLLSLTVAGDRDPELSPILMALYRPPGTETFSADSTAAMRAIAPHLYRAFTVQRRLEHLDLYTQATQSALDRMTYAVLVLDASGRIVAANRAAIVIAGAGDGLVVSSQGVRCLRQTDNRRLQQMIHGAIATGRGAATNAGGVMQLMRPSGRKPYALTVAPLTEHRPLFARRRTAAIVFISDPEDRMETPVGLLRRVYGLTPREAELAAVLATGVPLATAADHLSMAKETARRHLKSVFKKTDTQRQAELVRLLVILPSVSNFSKRSP